MKIFETLSAIEKSNRGGTYYEKGSLLEGIIVGLMFGVAVAVYHDVHKLIGILLLLAAIVLIIFLPNKFRGFRRCITFQVANTDLRYSTLVFSMFYFVLVSGTVALVLFVFKNFFALS